jgi:PAS domain S-box-containing protein
VNPLKDSVSALEARDPERQLCLLYETSMDALIVLDDHRRCVRVNEAAARLLSTPADKVLGRRLDDFIPREQRRAMVRLWADFESTGTHHGTFETLRRDGSLRMVEYRATSDFGAGQHLLAAREVGERRRGPATSRVQAPQQRGALTRREREVLQLAADGCSTRDIAEMLVVSHGTVKTHFQHIYDKLGARSRAAAVAQCLRRGLID